MPYLSFLFICLTWGTSFILMDRAAVALGPLTIGMCRLLGGALVLSLVWWWRGPRVRIAPSDWKHVLFVGALANAWPFTVLPYVMTQANEHGYFGLMVTLVPLVTILVSIPMLGIWPTARQMIGVIGGLICLAGVVHDGAQRGISPWVLALALTVPVTYAAGNTYIKWKLDHLPSLPLTVLFLACGGALLVPLQFATRFLAETGLGGPSNPHGWPMAIISIALLAAFSTGLAILLFIQLVKHQGPLFAGMVTYVIPLIAILWGQYDSEQLTTLQIAAMAGTLAMVALVQWGAAKPTLPQQEPLA
ncbi:DMT family transporter [Bythopirellula goksoeyrii]|uniref:Putative DMT superfamily transporter inner membrane protein n=1 Tax=Bythopirellula goksoeyrii TaxID=1400387 RepID=A0A5B9QH42_9BACT|nr:DMT family transporter [Bythopirellula goksoeyrii]QEG36965.1 putative DMT superfamily transporter inner membrane protein [Bythopirellula goksoeyrii]